MNMSSNVGLFSLAVGSFVGVPTALQAHDLVLAAGLTVFGLIMVFVYHKIPSPTV